MSELGDKIKDKIKSVSKGEYETWGLVAMVFEFIDEAEKEVSESYLESALAAANERIAELESENARLRAEVERLTALVQEKRS